MRTKCKHSAGVPWSRSVDHADVFARAALLVDEDGLRGLPHPTPYDERPVPELHTTTAPHCSCGPDPFEAAVP